jgi:histone H3/H4
MGKTSKKVTVPPPLHSHALVGSPLRATPLKPTPEDPPTTPPRSHVRARREQRLAIIDHPNWGASVVRNLLYKGGAVLVSKSLRIASTHLLRAIATEGMRAATQYTESSDRRTVTEHDVKLGFEFAFNKKIYN